MHLYFKEGSIGKACSAQPSSARKAQPKGGNITPRDLVSWSPELSGRSLSSYFSRILLVLLPSFPSFSFFDLPVVVVVVLVCVCVCLCKGAHEVCGMSMCAHGVCMSVCVKVHMACVARACVHMHRSPKDNTGCYSSAGIYIPLASFFFETESFHGLEFSK